MRLAIKPEILCHQRDRQRFRERRAFRRTAVVFAWAAFLCLLSGVVWAYYGLAAWQRRDWVVLAVPICVSLACAWFVSLVSAAVCREAQKGGEH